MSEFMFGVIKGKLSKREQNRREQVAKRRGATFVYGTFPGIGVQGWFAAPNLGAPFDEARARAVREELEREGIARD